MSGTMFFMLAKNAVEDLPMFIVNLVWRIVILIVWCEKQNQSQMSKDASYKCYT